MTYLRFHAGEHLENILRASPVAIAPLPLNSTQQLIKDEIVMTDVCTVKQVSFAFCASFKDLYISTKEKYSTYYLSALKVKS